MDMSEQQHTPGPWKVSEVEDGGEIISRGVKGPNGRGINTGCDIEMFSEADARLIAAAPELLAACKVADGLFAYGVGGVATDTQNRDRCIKEARAIMAQIRAAIAKAKGKTETVDAR
jgi:hypothetical protein